MAGERQPRRSGHRRRITIMRTKLTILFLTLAIPAMAQYTPPTAGPESITKTQSTNNLTEDFDIGTGITVDVESGGSIVWASGATATLNGIIQGTPLSGILNVSNLTLALSEINAATSDDDAAGLAANNTFTGSNDFTGGTIIVTDSDLPSTLTRDTEWDTAAEINSATTDGDFVVSDLPVRLLDRVAALDNRARANGTPEMVIAFLGDSLAARLPEYGIFPALKTRYGHRGLAMDSVKVSAGGGATSSPANTGAPENFDWWFNGKYFSIPAAGYVDFADNKGGGIGDYPFDRFSVYSVKTSGGGTFKIQYSTDGGSSWTDTAAGTIDTSTAGSDEGVVTTGTLDMEKQRLRVLGVSGTCYILGVKLWKSDQPGLVQVGIGRGGMTVSQQNQADVAVWGPVATDLGIDHIIWSQFEEELGTTVSKWTDEGYEMDWTLVGSPDNADNDTGGASVRLSVEESARALSNAIYFDANAAMGGWNEMEAMGWNDPDSLHKDERAWEVAGKAWLARTGVTDSMNDAIWERQFIANNEYVRYRTAEDVAQNLTMTLDVSDENYAYFGFGNSAYEYSDNPGRWLIGKTTAGDFAVIGRPYINFTYFRLDDETGRASFGANAGNANTDWTRLLVEESSNSYTVARFNHTGTSAATLIEAGVDDSMVWEVDGEGDIINNGNQVVGARETAVGDVTSTATSGSLPTPDGTITIADGASPTNAELLEYCAELEAKLETLLDRLGTSGHGLTAD
jgi:hypothetical protein